MRPPRGRSRRQDGSALIIALVFIATTGVVVAALLSFTEVGLRATKSYNFTERARVSYAAEGAIATAIKRYSTTGPCNNFTAPLVVGAAGPAPVNGQGVVVRCQGPPPAGRKATQPVNSLLSLGTADGDGIRTSKELNLIGDVFSTTTVSAGATMVVQDGEVSALGDCKGPIQTVPATPLRCANTGKVADKSQGRHPGYVSATTAVPQRRSVPACAPGWLVEIEPGYYDDAAALNLLTVKDAATPSCDNKVVWFKPGVYYFDLGFRGGSNVWTLSNETVTVVGGTPKGWDPGIDREAVIPPKWPSVPGSCKTGGDPGPGVQLIAGGATRLEVIKGRMELCAPPSTNDQQIALFGLGPDLPKRTLEASDITVAGFTACLPSDGGACSPALNVQSIEETPETIATAALRSDPSAPLTSASLDLKDFRPRVPPGSLIDSASVRFRHREDGPVDLRWSADFPSFGDASASTCGPAADRAPPVRPGPVEDDYIDLLDCGLTKPEQLNELSVVYRAGLASGGESADVHVDGVVVEVGYRSPITRKPTVVQASTGFGSPGNALEIAEQPTPLTADANINSPTAASITLAGFGDPPLPASATINSAFLRVAHREEGDTVGPTVSVPVGTCSKLLPKRAALTDDRVDLKACGLDTPGELKGLTATFTASLDSGGLAAGSRLDGMWLEVVSTGSAGAPPLTARRPAAAESEVPDPSWIAFSMPEAARAIGEAPPSTADATLSGTVNTAALTVSNFDGVPLPTGSVIRSARLRVAAQNEVNLGSVGITPTLPDRACPSVNRPGSPGPSLTEVDLTGCLTAPEQLADLRARYTANRTAVALPTRQVPATADEDGFVDAQQKGRAIDEVTAEAKLSSIGATQATVMLSGFNQARPPDGSTIESAVLRVGHRDDAVVAAAEVEFAKTGDCAPVNPQPNGGVDTIDLKACGLTDPTKLDQLTVRYRANLAPDATEGTAFLDGVELDLNYRPPAFASVEGVELDLEVEAPALRPLCTPTTANCDLLDVVPLDAADTTTRFVAAGTIYAPSAGVDISMNGVDTQVLQRGLIARSIHLGLQGARRPVAAIPPETVTFTAYPDETLEPANAESLDPATAEPPSTGFIDPDGAKSLRTPTPDDPSAASATLDATKTTASIDLSGYQTDLPDTTVIDAAALRVRHRDVGNTIEVTVKVGDITCVDKFRLAPRSSWSEDQVDLRGCGLTRPPKLDDLTVSYTATLDPDTPAAAATAELDGITMEVLAGPLVRATATFDGPRATIESWDVLR